MVFPRKKYLDELIGSEGNGMVKIVTGGRRCGKSFLLLNLYKNHLLANQVAQDHIIGISLDERENKPLRDPDNLLEYVKSKQVEDGQTTYVILDEIQLVEDFVEVLLSLMHRPDLEVFVSGSNSRFLSTDVVTEFRGRGDEIRIWPLTFAEYYEEVGGDRNAAWRDYSTFGGLPQAAVIHDPVKKMEYLKSIYELTYLKDIIDRHHLRNSTGLRQLTQILSSCIGSPTNPHRISNTFKSVEHVDISSNTIDSYLSHLQDAFLIEEAMRYDVKGRKYIGTESKYYFVDMGLRGAVLNFRQMEENHIMENVIYNELRCRGFAVDVGIVKAWRQNADKQNFHQAFEVDFVANKGYSRYYVQSAFSIPDETKREQEEHSLRIIDDAFKRIIILRDDITPHYNERGFLMIGLLEFLLNPRSLEL